MNVMVFKFEYDSFTLFSINDNKFFKLTLFFSYHKGWSNIDL